MKYKYDRKLFVAAAFALLFALLILMGSFSNIETPFLNTIIDLNDNWQISLNGNVFDSHNPSKTNIGVIDEGDVVELTTTLPSVSDYADPCLSFYAIHSLIEVSIDDEVIYTFGHEAYEEGRTVPKTHTAIPLKREYSGKTLKISLTGAKVSAFSGLSSFYIGERKDTFVGGIIVRRLSILSGIFLISLGFLLIILSPYLLFYHNNDTRLVFSGFISLFLGFYIMSYYGLIDLLIGNPTLNTICEYVSLYNIPTCILGYLMSVFSGKKKQLFRFMFITNLTLFIIIIILHISQAMRFTDFTMPLHTLAAIESFIAMYLIAKNLINKKTTSDKKFLLSDSIFLLGLSIFMIASLIDIVIYNYNKYFTAAGETNSDITITTIGALIFVSCLLISYLYYNIYSSNFETMQSHIVNLAYTDALTGLANRARCEQVMAILSEDRGTYTIVSLDLNKLKQVNDTLGHHEGDRLIVGFATILSECFWDANLIGRMGGDEFIVVMTDEHALNCTKRIHELYNIISEWNSKEQAFQYSTSYGYAYSYEVPNGLASEVYMLADSRMYEMKKEHRSDNSKEVENA